VLPPRSRKGGAASRPPTDAPAIDLPDNRYQRSMQRARGHLLALSFLISLALVASVASSGQAQVDCDTPDDLCVGDPCVIGTTLVDASCVLDFGARTVVVAGRLRIPSDGELSLSAGVIQITGSVENLRPLAEVSGGPKIYLVADGDIALEGQIRLAGAQRGVLLPGEVTLDAGGGLTVEGRLSATTSPTTILYRATGGDLVFRGRVNTLRDGGEITLSASGSVALWGSLRRLDDIIVEAGTSAELRGSATPQSSLTVDAGGLLTLDTSVRAPGADVVLHGGSGVVLQKSIYLTPLFVFSGSAEIVSTNGPVTISRPLRSVDVTVSAAGDIAVDAAVSATPPTRSGGTITLISTGGDVIVSDRLRAQAGDGTQPLDGAGGHIHIVAAELVSIAADIQVNAFPGRTGAPGGTLQVDAGRVLATEVHFDADGDSPGPDFAGSPAAGFRLTSTLGEISLDGDFLARGGPSVIEVAAATDLVAAGSFQVAPDGCIGLSAGGTIDTSAASFDTPVVTDCP